MNSNTEAAIEEATALLMGQIASRNHIGPQNVVSAFFTLTDDLNAAFPAETARLAGWDVPMLDMRSPAVPGSLPRCLRVMLHVEDVDAVRHVYLGEAARLRPDLEAANE